MKGLLRKDLKALEDEAEKDDNKAGTRTSDRHRFLLQGEEWPILHHL